MNNLSSHLLNLLIFNMLAFWGHKYGCVHISSHLRFILEKYLLKVNRIRESLSLIKKTNK